MKEAWKLLSSLGRTMMGNFSDRLGGPLLSIYLDDSFSIEYSAGCALQK